MFNLRDDVGETRDLAATRADVAARLRKLFESARAESKDFPTKPVRATNGKSFLLGPAWSIKKLKVGANESTHCSSYLLNRG